MLVSEEFKMLKVQVLMARLDEMHPVVSGNKLFKLHYFLEAAMQAPHRTLLTFGGAYSNHLVATAFACNDFGLKSIGIVRGEKPAVLSYTLQHCISYGMQLHYTLRSEYKTLQSDENSSLLQDRFGEAIIVPEGGYSPTGARGAALIMQHIAPHNATHICAATGTATTLAGLVQGRQTNQQIIGIPVLKNMHDIEERIQFLCGCAANEYTIFDGYHFGGYAKKNAALLAFMNDVYAAYKIPIDFVYTAKMLYAVFNKISAGYFSEGSTIVCLHTGGLQGNASLPQGSLIF